MKLSILFVGLFLARLFWLQVAEGEYYRVLADENRVSLIIEQANRGVIYDRFGEVMNRNGVDGREYVYGKSASQVLGYVGEVSEEELEACADLEYCDLSLGEIVGKLGIESQYDELLRGVSGGMIVEQDANGQVLREMGRKEPVDGQNISVNLDAGLQRKAYELMEERKGALIASIPQTGEILALISSPGFDPDKVEKYLTDQDLPLFNRAISGVYPPASTFKIITALAALEEGKIDDREEIEDTGELVIGPYKYGNWYYSQYGRKEGFLNLARALARSNDIYFYTLGERLGIRHLADWAKYFGLSRLTGIDLPGEAAGLMPDDLWKKEHIKEDWFLGDTFITAIGQGNILTTPLQVNQMMAVVAADGMLCQPQVLKQKANCTKLNITKEHLASVKEGLRQVTATGGTAFPFFEFKVKDQLIEVGGKTGTAEFGDKEEAKTHAWFTVLAPYEKPEIVVTVLLEGAGEGSYEAAPVAKELLTYWFDRQ